MEKFVLILLLGVSSVHAAEVNLDCSLTIDKVLSLRSSDQKHVGKEYSFEVDMDLDEGKAVLWNKNYSVDNNLKENRMEISNEWVSFGILGETSYYTISRVDLSIRMVWDFGDSSRYGNGSCAVVERDKPQTAF